MVRSLLEFEDPGKYKISVVIEQLKKNIIIGEIDIDLPKQIHPECRINSNMTFEYLKSEALAIVIEELDKKYKNYKIRLHHAYTKDTATIDIYKLPGSTPPLKI